MFYISHLYQITMQSTVNVAKLQQHDTRSRPIALGLTHKDTFHRYEYLVILPGYRTLAYFWLFFYYLLVGLHVLFALEDSSNHIIAIVAVVWLILNAAINYKSLLLGSSAVSTCFTLACGAGMIIGTLIISSLVFSMSVLLVCLVLALYILTCACGSDNHSSE